ncbi:MAG: thiolase family protein [Deltaproteobacteria bacterium]|nr:thiolase family protein [Deltaproteobacteria bacterium]
MEAVIVAAVRSPMGRSGKGLLQNMRIDDLGAVVVREVLKRVPNLDPKEIEDVQIGCAMPEGEQGMNVARQISMLSGIPLEAAATTINRFCASGLESICNAALRVMTSHGDVFVAGGVESMSHVPMGGFNPSLNEKFFQGGLPQAYVSMGITAENVASKYKVSREDQDRFALGSHRKAVAAQKEGKFKSEMMAIEVQLPDGKKVLLDRDETPREECSLEQLAKLKPAFLEGGSVTAGNSSPLTDGAAAVVVMSIDRAKALGIRPLVKIRAMAVAGLEPEYMGMGPVPAVKKVLKRAGMTLKDIDVIEINEAFASQSLAVIRELDLDMEKVNPHGGAIALGHPLGCSGSRIMATLINGLIIKNKTVGLETMCIGGGQGMAAIVERL